MCYSSHIPLKPELFLKSIAWVCVGSTAPVPEQQQQQQTPPSCGERQPRPLLGAEPSTGCTGLEKDAAPHAAGKSPTH